MQRGERNRRGEEKSFQQGGPPVVSGFSPSLGIRKADANGRDKLALGAAGDRIRVDCGRRVGPKASRRVQYPRYQVEQIPTAIALVEAGLGVTALPSLTFSMFKGRNLAVRPLVQPRLRRNVGFVTFSGRTMPGFASALCKRYNTDYCKN